MYIVARTIFVWEYGGMNQKLHSLNPVKQAREGMTLDQQFLTKVQVAALFAVSQRTITNWMRKKMIPYLKMGTSHQADVRFRHSDILEKMNAERRVN
jgi:hypothetical protein